MNRFTTVDEATNPDDLVDLMDRARTLSEVQRSRQLARSALGLKPGDRVLDLGCGTGDETLELARLVGPDGEAVGVDFSSVMVEQARSRSESAGLPVHFEEGDSQKLRFADDAFAGCRAERMLCHVPDTAAALSEMIRVVRPGGSVVVIDVDLEAVLLDSPDVAFTRLYFTSFADTLCHGRMARELPRHFRQAGLREVTAFPLLAEMEFDLLEPLFRPHLDALLECGTADPEQADRWWKHLHDAGAAGTFFLAMPLMVISGRTP